MIRGVFLIASDDYLYMSGSIGDIREKELAWFRKLDQDGNILWHRYYVDSTKKKIMQYFSSFVEDRNGGFALTGLNLDTFPNHDPAEFNWDIWFVTLDKDGCFNGDCGDTIYLNQKIPNHSYGGGFKLDELLEFYPNPARDVVHIQFRNASERLVSIISMDGLLLEEKWLQEDYNQLRVSDYPPGNYKVKIEDKKGRFIVIPLQVLK